MKKIKLMICAIVVAAAAGNISITATHDGMPGIATQNIDVLARGESDYMMCWGMGSLQCPLDNQKAYAILY